MREFNPRGGKFVRIEKRGKGKGGSSSSSSGYSGGKGGGGAGKAFKKQHRPGKEARTKRRTNRSA
jgi:hypothetical protein